MLRNVFLAVITMQGLIHFLGFFKAFNPVGVRPLSQGISKPAGTLWLIAALLFISLAVLYFAGKEWWWLVGFFAVALSQILILLYWRDFKFLTVLNVIVLITTVMGFALWNFNKQVSRETEKVLAENVMEKEVITEETIADLPEPVQRWLKYSGIIGREQITSVYLKQKGLMKMKPEQGWLKAEAEQYFTVDNPAFIWAVETSMMGLPVVGRDLFIDGEGGMQIKLAGFIPVVNVRGNPKLNEATLQRFLAEIIWFPSAAVSRYISWEGLDDNSAKATMSSGKISGSVVFHFNNEGELTRLVTQRYKDIADEKPTEWVATVKETQEVDGIKLPAKLEVAWLLEEGEFTWYKFEIYDLKYNNSGKGERG